MADRGRSDADEALAAAIAAGRTVRDAAATAGVSERTADRRLADALGEASDVLRALLTSGEDRVKLRAASEVLTQGLRVAELVELQRRVEELERRQNAAGGTP